MATGTGNLPNPGMSFSPFAILTAEEQNNLVENIESLATGTGIGDGSIGTADIANNAITQIRLDVDETTDFASPLSLTSNTWVDLKGNQSFTVTSPTSVVTFRIAGGVGVGTTAGISVVSRVMIDSGGTPITKRLDTIQIPTGNTAYPFVKFGIVSVTGLSAGTHTIKTQLYSAASTTTAFCRAATVPATEWFNTQVIEYKK